jgi:protein-S-isoprenylcysteine O-methyltransferase Ste14
MSPNQADSPGVRVPPPLVFLGGLAIGLVLSTRAPTEYLDRAIAHLVGGVLIGMGVLLASSAVYAFFQARTNLRPDRPSSALVRTGPYRFTRNPMYVSLTMVYVGVAVMTQSLWSLLLLPLVVAFIRSKVIAREEAYMERRFGAEYLRYKSEVRRWV